MYMCPRHSTLHLIISWPKLKTHSPMEPFIIYLERDIVRCMIMYTRKKKYIYIYHNVTKLKLIRLVTSGWLLQGDEK